MAMTLPRRFFPSLVDPNASPMLYAALLLLVAVAVAIAAYVLFERPVTRVLQKQISKLYPVSQAELRSGEALRQTAVPPAIKSLDGLAER
jgi:peptidoglycan/LPS O-acetylase OafA/YrhL